MMAAKAFYPLSLSDLLAFVIQGAALRANDAASSRVDRETLCGVGIVFGGFAFGRRCQYVHAFGLRGLQVGPAAVTGIGQRQRLRGGDAQVLAGLLNHGCELARIGFLAVDLTSDKDLFLLVGDGLGIVGVAIGIAHFHAAGFRFDRMIVRASVALKLGQPFFDFLT